MFLKIFMILALIGGSVALAQHKTTKAHVHGQSTWSLAFDGKTGKLIIDTSGESILDFEYEPKTKKDVLKVNESLLKFEREISKMVQIPSQYGCQWSKKTLDVIRDEGDKKHCEVEAEFEISCQNDLGGAEIKFFIQKYFPKFRSVSAEILFGNIQKSFPANQSGVKFYLK